MLVSLGAILAFTLFSRSPSFNSLDEFSIAWKATPKRDRHKVVGWLLGGTPLRGTTYSLADCKLRGLSKNEVFAILGPETVDNSHTDRGEHIFYPIGSIEYDFLGVFFGGKRDVLYIELDDNGIVTKVRTTS